MQHLTNKTVLVAPLDWGLGHTTRCIPIIYALQKYSFTIIVAIAGNAKKIIESEFPNLKIIDIPNYNVEYGKSKITTIIKLTNQLVKIKKAILRENEWLKEVVQKNSIDIVISDNRYGLYNKNVQTVFITHQLKPKALVGNFGEKFLQKKLYTYINKFNYCWVMDYANENNLAGTLSHPTLMPKVPTTYIGAVTRLHNYQTEIKYTCAVILSGPEPQRTILENKIVAQLKNVNYKTILIRGLPNEYKELEISNNYCTIVNYAGVEDLNKIILQSECIISRSGYTSIMDLFLLQKKCIFIPTPAQSEQEYLATYLAKKNYCITYTQNEFNIKEALIKANAFNFVLFKKEEENLLEQNISKLLK